MKDDDYLMRVVIPKMLEDTAEDMRNGESPCNLTPSEIKRTFGILNNPPMSKAKAYEYLGISRSKFDSLVREGVIPRGRKYQGFTELVWYKKDLNRIKDNI